MVKIDKVLVNSSKQYFALISKERAHRLYKELYMKCIYWLERLLTIGSKKVLWKLLITKNGHVSKTL